jgi:hypothetical protein
MHTDPHPELDGLPATAVARTIIDCAETYDALELLALLDSAWERGVLDLDAYAAVRARVPWRPWLGRLDNVYALFRLTL